MSKKKAAKKTHIGSFFFGFVLLCFAAFGIYKAGSFAAAKVNELRNGGAKFSEYETFLEPFVVVDPAPFDDISGAEQIDLLDAAVSALIYESDKMNTYDVFEGEVTGLLVPQQDVEAYFKRLFGTEVTLTHQSVADSFYNVIYNSEKRAYIIPITSVDPIYTPKVYDMERTGSSVTLTVGFIGGSEWAQLENGSYTAPDPVKYMKITLREDADGYHIGSLRSSDSAETADPAKTTAPSTTQMPVTQPAAEQPSVTQAASTTLPPEIGEETGTQSSAGETTDEAVQATGLTVA